MVMDPLHPDDHESDLVEEKLNEDHEELVQNYTEDKKKKALNATVLVVGSTGYIGRFITQVLHERGFKVRR